MCSYKWIVFFLIFDHSESNLLFMYWYSQTVFDGACCIHLPYSYLYHNFQSLNIWITTSDLILPSLKFSQGSQHPNATILSKLLIFMCSPTDAVYRWAGTGTHLSCTHRHRNKHTPCSRSPTHAVSQTAPSSGKEPRWRGLSELIFPHTKQGFSKESHNVDGAHSITAAAWK